MAAAFERSAFMTLAEFLVWDAPSGPLWQLIDGVPQAMAPASGTHAVMQNEVGRLIGNHLDVHRPGCRALANPGVVPRVDSEDNFRIPDIGVTCAPVPRGVIEIAEPILLIEILSPGNSAETWANVWAYTNIQSVQEILVIRTASIGAQLLRRTPDGFWPDVPLAIEVGELDLQSIGFRLPVAALHAGTWLVEQA
jgi:Uma2 family endonuclease